MWNTLNKFLKFLNRLRIDNNFGTVAGGNVIASLGMSGFWFLLASMLSTEEYGELGYYLALVMLFGSISRFGFVHTVTTYLAKGEEKILPQANFVVLISNVVIMSIMFLFIEHLPTVLLLSALSFFTMSRAEDLGRQNFKKYSFFVIAQRFVHIPLSLSLFVIMGIDGILLGHAISSIIFSINFFRTFKNFNFDFIIIKEKFSFIIHLFTQDVSPRIANNIDKLLIVNLFGLAILGEYQLGFQALILLSVIPTSTIQFLLPRESSGNHDGKVWKKIIIIALGSSFLVVFLIPQIIPSILPHFVNSIEPAQIMSLGVIPWTIISIFNSKLISTENTKFVLLGSIIRISTQMILLILLGEQFGIIGLALAMTLSLIAHSIAVTIFYKLLFVKEI